MTLSKNEQIDADLRDPSKQTPPETHKTVIGRTAPPESKMDGSREPVPVDGNTGGVVPKDDIPWVVEKKDGPKDEHSGASHPARNPTLP